VCQTTGLRTTRCIFFKGEPIPRDGKLQPPDKPGWGVELDRELVRQVESGI